MPAGIYVRTEEHNQHISEALRGNPKLMGHIPWNKGLSAKNDKRIENGVRALLVSARSEKGRKRSGAMGRKYWLRFWGGMSEEEKAEFIEQKAVRIRATRGKPDAVAKQTAGMLRAYEKNPELRVRHSEAMKELYKDKEYKANHLERMRHMFAGRQRSWDDPDRRERRVRAWFASLARKPSDIEQRLIDIIERFNLPYKYVGNGEFLLGGKNPDFLNVNGHKKLIEMFGDMWHKRGSEVGRQAFFRQYGFDTLIIWGSDFGCMSDEEIVSIVRDFDDN